MRRPHRLALAAALAAALFVSGCDLFQKYRVWEATFNTTSYPTVQNVIATPDSGAVVCGYSTVYGQNGMSYPCFLVRFGRDGGVLWSRDFDFGAYSQVRTAQPVSDGGFVMTGSGGGSDVAGFLARTDSNGVALWTRRFDDSMWTQVSSACGTADGGFTFAVSGGNNATTPSLVHVDASGTLQWARVVPETPAYFTDLVPAAGGGYMLFGWNWFVRLDENGGSLWSGTMSYDVAFHGLHGLTALCATRDGGFLFIDGNSYYYGPQVAAPAALLRVGASGDSVWATALAGSDFEFAKATAELPDGGFAVVGQMKVFLRPPDAGLLTVDDRGRPVHARRYGRDETDAFQAVAVAPDGDVIAAGELGGSSYDSGILMVVKAEP